jgi:16S rRNA (cytosine967-C5)-methyltransferase
VIAVEKIPNKVKKIRQTAERLQIQCIHTITERTAFHYGPVAPAYDRVLLDVPAAAGLCCKRRASCAGRAAQDIPELLKLQEAALDLGARFVHPRAGWCTAPATLNRQENEEQIQRFLERHDEFELLTPPR